MTILNKYKNIFKNFVNNSGIKPPNMPELVDKELCNIISNSKNSSTESKLDENILHRSKRE